MSKESQSQVINSPPEPKALKYKEENPSVSLMMLESVNDQQFQNSNLHNMTLAPYHPIPEGDKMETKEKIQAQRKNECCFVF